MCTLPQSPAGNARPNRGRFRNLCSIAATLALVVIASGPVVAAEEPAAPGLTVYNRGIGGQNTRQGRARFEQDVVALKPNYVLIYFGLNDALNERAVVPLEEFVENLTWMVARAREAGIVPVLCTIHAVEETALFTRHKREFYGQEGPNGKLRHYNAAIRKLAAEQKVLLADFASRVEQAQKDNADGKAGRNDLVSPDGVHLTLAGNRALAQCFLDALAGKLQGEEVIVCLGDSVTYGAHHPGAGTAEGDTYPAMLRRLK